MTSSNPLLQPILASPLMPRLLAELNTIALEEAEKRSDFYAWLDEDKRAEFLLGEVIVHSPARAAHIDVLDNLHFLLRDFVKKNLPGSRLSREQAMIRLNRSDLMPDLVFFLAEKAQFIKPDTKLFPIPDFVVEVLSPSTEKYDRGKKMQEYAANGIREYWIVSPDEKTVEQYLLHHEEYQLKTTARPGENLSAFVLSGLNFDPAAVFEF